MRRVLLSPSFYRWGNYAQRSELACPGWHTGEWAAVRIPTQTCGHRVRALNRSAVLLGGMCPNHLMGLLRHGLLGPSPEFLVPVGLGWGSIIFIFNKYPGGAMLLAQGLHFENACPLLGLMTQRRQPRARITVWLCWTEAGARASRQLGLWTKPL